MSDYVKQLIIQALYILPIMLITLPVHETAHGYAAYKLGDPTAKLMGRLTLNPAKHFDPVGFLCMIICRFGWAKPVPVNPNNFRNPKRDMAITALAGPASNLLMGLCGTVLYTAAYKLLVGVSFESSFALTFFSCLLTFLSYFASINVGLAVFNLIPIVPLDGSRILYYFLPDRIIYRLRPYERYIQLALFALLIFGALSTPLSYVSGKVFNAFYYISDKVTAFI